MKRVQDIVISDNSLKLQYVNDFINKNYNDAFNLINDNFETKKITIDFFKNIYSKLYNLENLYFVNVPEFLAAKLNDIQYFIDNLMFLGEWNYSTVYKAYNLVRYENSIYMYMGDNPASGLVPVASGRVTLIINDIIEEQNSASNEIIIYGGTINNQGMLNTDNLFINSPWLKLDIRGEKGTMGLGINYRGIWDASFSYNEYDSVFYNNSLWACKIINQNIIPQNGSYWDEIFKVYKAKIENYSSVSNPYNGLICFEII